MVTRTLEELAELVGGVLTRGEPGKVIDGIAALNEAGATEISFFGNEKYYQQFLATRAGAVIVPRGLNRVPEEVALIEVDEPSQAFGKAVAYFREVTKRVFVEEVHPRAVVDGTAKLGRVRLHAGVVVGAEVEIGDGTEVGPNVVIYEGVKIGRDCMIHANVTIRERCVLRDRVILQPGVVIGADGYGYQLVDGRHERVDQVGVVELEDDVEVGANSTIDRARFGRTVIGEGTKIDNLVQIGHNARVGRHNLIVAQTGMAGSSQTEDYVVMAAQVGVAGHIKVGAKAVLSARTGATSDLEGGKTYAGTPARPLMDHQRCKVLTSKLPEMLKRLKDLEARVEAGD